MGLATQDGLLSQLSTVALNELPDDYLETYRQRVRALTPQELLATRAQISGFRQHANRCRRRPHSNRTASLAFWRTRSLRCPGRATELAFRFISIVNVETQLAHYIHAMRWRSFAIRVPPIPCLLFGTCALAKKKPPAKPVNTNTSTSEELQQVPGIGRRRRTRFCKCANRTALLRTSMTCRRFVELCDGTYCFALLSNSGGGEVTPNQEREKCRNHQHQSQRKSHDPFCSALPVRVILFLEGLVCGTRLVDAKRDLVGDTDAVAFQSDKLFSGGW